MVARDVLAGVLLVNAIPHTVRGLTGKRGLTPLGGEDSSPATNLVWAAMNVAGGAAALTSSGWRSIDQPTAEERLAAVTLGAFAMTAFATVYEFTAGRRKRARRTDPAQ